VKVYLSINGTGCSLITDWRKVKRLFETFEATITRCDVAVDAMDGEFSVDDALSWYSDGGFIAGGTPPKFDAHGGWSLTNGVITLPETGAGRTFYVGKRVNGKYVRIYEKGKQLGNRDSLWTRFEIELHNKDRVIPHDIIVYPSSSLRSVAPATGATVLGGLCCGTCSGCCNSRFIQWAWDKSFTNCASNTKHFFCDVRNAH
jgi:phage replication initiation protein